MCVWRYEVLYVRSAPISALLVYTVNLKSIHLAIYIGKSYIFTTPVKKTCMSLHVHMCVCLYTLLRVCVRVVFVCYSIIQHDFVKQ